VDRAELETLSTLDLHDKAMDVAMKRMDVAWVWRVLRSIPAAEAAAGDEQQAKGDIASPMAQIKDFLFNADEGELGAALRPLYIDYLLEHGRD